MRAEISVFCRTLSQILEGILAKCIYHAEKQLKSNEKLASPILKKLSKVAKALGQEEYSEKIIGLSNELTTSPETHNQFMRSINEIGLYFEAPSFANFNLANLQNVISTEFGIHSSEPVLLSNKLIKYMSDKLKLDCPIHKDIILPNIFVAPIYTIKVKQEAYYRSTARDFGSYKVTNRQPSQGRNKEGLISQSSKLGQMEFDGVLGHNLPTVIKELRTVKNDSQSMKSDMAHQIITTGEYNLPNITNTSYTKYIIDSLIELLHS